MLGDGIMKPITLHILKEVMIHALLLALPDFLQPFILESDASGTGMSAILMQRGRSIAYLSDALHGCNINLSTNEKEVLAIIIAVQKLCPYLLGSEFIILTDKRSLKFLLEQRIANPIQDCQLNGL